jgi:hypothetical protein
MLPVILAAGVAGTVTADVAPDRKSTLTITSPLEVPGATLDPGTYVVKIVDSGAGRNVVAFTTADEKKVLALALATPHEASNDPRQSTFVFYATPEGATKALRTWYVANDRNGHDFVYPPDRAAALKEVSNTDVPALTSEQSLELARRAVRASTEAAVVPAATTADASNLPRTASRRPLVLAFGFAALALASVLRVAGRS